MHDTMMSARYARTEGQAARDVPFPVQVLSIVFFAGFAMIVSVVAIDEFWPAGIALAAFLAYQWGRIPTLRGGRTAEHDFAALCPQTAGPAPAGNASFDGYRAELLKRLEQEQEDFRAFLERLRDAKDKAEFDRFMDARAEAAKEVQHDDRL